MLAKLTRILLALCTAFVFTGQMEAAAQHCARLALAAEHAIHEVPAAAQHHADHHAETPPCHETAHAVETSHHASHTKAPADHCDCIAALKMCTQLPAAFANHAITPYAWLVAATPHFASTTPAPDWRPPRA